MIYCRYLFLSVLIYPIKWVALQLLRTLKCLLMHSPKIARRKLGSATGASKPVRQRGKPAWVKKEVLRLKALMPVGTGVRKIAATFNRMQSNNTQASQCQHISKTYVANLIGSNRLEIHNMRKQVRSRAPGAGRINHTWGIDLTGKFSSLGQLHFILGIIDHGSRRRLGLLVSTKHALAIGAQVARMAQQYGKPKCIRTDNERCFTSQAFTQQLAVQGIQMQRSDMHCPWQNGRIERLFGTLKQYLNQLLLTPKSSYSVCSTSLWFGTTPSVRISTCRVKRRLRSGTVLITTTVSQPILTGGQAGTAC